MKEKIRKLFLSLGADTCGFAAINRFDDAPDGFSPKDLYGDCKTVIVIGKEMPKGLSQVNPRMIYHHFHEFTFGQVDQIELQGSLKLEKDFDCHAVPIPCDTPYEYWDETSRTGKGLMSIKHAAVAAGLGTLGKSTLLIHPDFGNRLAIGVILTDLVLESDSLCADQCITGCNLCIDTCPSHAIKDGRVRQALCRKSSEGQTAKGYEALTCNTCRVICPKNK